jgi:phosphopantetheine adenylyltransferase
MVLTNQRRTKMTEQQIEVMAERKIDRLDALFLRGAITEQQYNAALKQIRQWADEQYRVAA